MSTGAKPPTALTVIGWISMIGGGMMALSGGMGLVAWGFMELLTGKSVPAPVPGDPAAIRIVATVFQYFGVLCCMQLVFAGIVAYAGRQLLKRRAWARAALEGVYWLALFWVVGFGTFWVLSWLELTTAGPANTELPAMSSALPVFGVLVGVVVMGGLAVATFVVIRIIRSKPVREAVAP